MANGIPFDGQGHRVVGVSLIDLDIKQSLLIDEKEPDAQFEYEADIESLESVDTDLVVFSCFFALRKLYPGETDDVTRIAAKYYCGVRGGADESSRKSIARAFAATTVWSQFTSLCALTSQQMGVSFPLLPPAPNTIGITNKEDV